MAKSGTIDGTRSGYRPYLRINWNIDQTDIPGNRTRLRLQLYLMHPYNVQYSATKSGKLQGVSFSSTKNVRGTGNTLLQTRYIWVKHNSDGTKTQNLNASFNIAITFGGSRLNSLSVSGKAVLERIPRKTDLTSASITSLQASSSATLSIGRDVKYSGFYHLVTILDGSTWIWDTGYKSGSPSTSYTVKSSTVDKMLGRMRSVTKKTFRVRIRTYTGSGGSGYIGESIRNVDVSVHSSVAPSASGIGADILGSGKDDSMGKFVQNISRVYASFSSSATGGAGVSSRSITIRKVGGADSQTISGGSGSTSREVRSSGTYEAIGTIRDTRGRTNSSRMTFTVHSYLPPTISTFSADREPDTPTIVKIERRGSHSNLGGDNRLTISVQKRQGSGSWTNVVSDVSTTSSSFGTTLTSTSNSVTRSYDFRVFIVDEFNNRAEAVITVSTQRVVLDIHKNEGVGIGKIHERGVLDVDGEAYFRGNIEIEPRIGATRPGFKLISQDKNGHAYIEMYGSDSKRKAYMGIPNSTSTWLHVVNESGGPVNISGSDVLANGTSIVGSGSNKNGNWVQFYDGTQICFGYVVILADSGTGDHKFGTATFPKSFVNTDYRVVITPDARGVANFGAHTTTNHTTSNFGIWITRRSNSRIVVEFISIGRWK